MFCISLNTSFLTFVNKHQEAEKATYPSGSNTWIGEGMLVTSEMETAPCHVQIQGQQEWMSQGAIIGTATGISLHKCVASAHPGQQSHCQLSGRRNITLPDRGLVKAQGTVNPLAVSFISLAGGT